VKEFWEEAFQASQEIWGFAPAKSTVLKYEFFTK
jgi:hypothetical protein